MTDPQLIGPMSRRTSALIMLLAALGRLLWRGLRFAPPQTPKSALGLTRCTDA